MNDLGSRALTGLRGMAALLVVLHHLYLREHLQIPLINTLAMRGYLAVDLFFVLSGFVMALAYGSWFDGQWTVRAYALFMSRRVARLWPLHTAVVLAVVGITTAAGQTGVFWPKMIVANLLMVQSWGWSQVIVSPSWSVSTEMLAYVLFPVLAAVTLHGRRRVAWAAALLAVVVLVACMRLAPATGAGRRGALDIYDNWSLLPAARCLAGFSLGLLTWRALRAPAVQRWAVRSGTALVAAVVLILALASGVPDGAVYVALPVLIGSLYAGAGPLQRLLARRIPVILGTLSYAIYLVHVPVLEMTQRLVGTAPALLVPVFLVAVAGVAAAAHWAIEQPMQAVLRRALTRPWRRRLSVP